MTKPRPPLTAYSALLRIAALIGYDGCAACIGKTEGTVRKYADQDAEWEISFRDAIRLDLAYRRSGGDGAPLFEVYAARMEIENHVDATGDSILRSVREAARKSGEAVDAAVSLAIKTGRKQEAIKEVSEAVGAFSKLLTLLTKGSDRV